MTFRISTLPETVLEIRTLGVVRWAQPEGLTASARDQTLVSLKQRPITWLTDRPSRYKNSLRQKESTTERFSLTSFYTITALQYR